MPPSQPPPWTGEEPRLPPRPRGGLGWGLCLNLTAKTLITLLELLHFAQWGFGRKQQHARVEGYRQPHRHRDKVNCRNPTHAEGDWYSCLDGSGVGHAGEVAGYRFSMSVSVTRRVLQTLTSVQSLLHESTLQSGLARGYPESPARNSRTTRSVRCWKCFQC